jgi:glycosyl transferase family 1
MRIGPPWCALEINALQRASTLVIQKSLKEGFGLTVTEALWKGKPTIAGAPSELRNSPSVSLSDWTNERKRYKKKWQSKVALNSERSCPEE